MNIIENLETLDMSPYDENLGQLLFAEAMNYRMEEANYLAGRIYEESIGPTPYAAIGNELHKSQEKTMRLVVDTSDQFMDQYKQGLIRLANENGNLYAQIKENGRYGKKLPIKEEFFSHSLNVIDISNALQLKAIQDSIEEVNRQLRIIDRSVKEVLMGQQNDRLGLYYSGVALFLEAMSLENEDMKREMVAQSLKALSDSTFQLMLTMKTDIKYLENRGYKEDKKNQFKLMQERINSVDQSFLAIHQASIFKAAIYCQQGELKAMAKTLQTYANFINETVVENAEMLAQCDATDTGTLEGTWKRRATLELDVSNVVEKLSKPAEVMYIDCLGGEDESV